MAPGHASSPESTGRTPLHSELGWAAWIAPRPVPACAICFFPCPQEERLCLPSSDNLWAPSVGTTPHQFHVPSRLSVPNPQAIQSITVD